MSTVNTNIKIDVNTKKEAQKLFKNLGINLNTAVNLFLEQVIKEQGIPFHVENLQTNEDLLETIREVEKMKKNPSTEKRYLSVQEMFASLLCK